MRNPFHLHFLPLRPPDEVSTPAEELDDLSPLNATTHVVTEDEEETDKDKTMELQAVSPVTCPKSQPKIHSRKFRE